MGKYPQGTLEAIKRDVYYTHQTILKRARRELGTSGLNNRIMRWLGRCKPSFMA